MTTTKNPYDHDLSYAKNRAWDEGWSAGYDDNEETWIKQILPIVGELEEHIRYDWENNDCLQVRKIKMLFDVFVQYPPEHDWLEQLIKDAVAAYKQHKWDDLSKGELEDFKSMAKSFGISIVNLWKVTISAWDITSEGDFEAIEDN